MYRYASFKRLLFCVLVLSQVGCDQNPQPKAPEQAKKSREEVSKKLEDRKTQAIAEFTTKYNADGTWQKLFKRNPVWTMEVEDRLIPHDGRPILSTGSLHDVRRKGVDYMLHFKQGFIQDLVGVLGGVDIQFMLKCNLPEDRRTEARTLGEQISSRALGNLHEDYVFVAKIQTVERRERLVAKVAEEERAEIQVDDSPHFLATGECLAVKYIGE